VIARPPSATYRFHKAFRRHKLAFGAGGAIVLALLLGLGISIWQYAGKSHAEREQHRLREQAESRAREASEAQVQASQQRDLARELLRDSYVREARSIRNARQIGYRGEAFARLKDAQALGIPHADASLLRNEAVACLGDWVGLTPIDIEIPGRVASATLTADGNLIAIGAWDRRVSLREAQTGREAAVLELAGIPFSLVFDLKGTALFASVVDQFAGRGQRPTSVHLEKWSVRGDGSWRREWLKPKNGSIGCFETASGPVSLKLGPIDAYLAVEEPDTDTEIARIPLESPMPWLPVAAIRADRRQLALFTLDGSGGFDAQLEVWDLDSKKRVAHVQPHLGPGWGLSYGLAGRTLAVTYDNTLIVHDTAQFGTSINIGGAFEHTWGAAVGGSSDGLLAVPSMQELGVRLIQFHSGGEVAYLKLPGTPVSSHFSADGSVLLLTHTLGARVMHLKLDQEKFVLEGHQGGVPAAEFSPNGTELASAGKDRTLRIWDLASSRGSRVLGHLPAPGQTLAYTPDGEHLVCGYYNTGELSLWSVANGKQVARISSDAAHTSTTWSCAISPDGRYLAAVSSGIRIWDLPRLLQPLESPAWTSQPFISSTNGTSCLQFDAAGTSVLYQVCHGEPPEESAEINRQSLEPTSPASVVATNIQANYVQAQCLLPKRGELAYVTQDREIAVLESSTGKVLRILATREAGDKSGWFIGNLRVSPDETRFALVTPSGLGVEIRDVLTGKMLYTLPEETGSIWWLAWNPDSQRLAVTRASGEIAVWNLREVESQLAKLGLKP